MRQDAMIHVILTGPHLLRLVFVLRYAILAQGCVGARETDVEIARDIGLARVAREPIRQWSLRRGGVQVYVELECMFGVGRVVHDQQIFAQDGKSVVVCDVGLEHCAR